MQIELDRDLLAEALEKAMAAEIRSASAVSTEQAAKMLGVSPSHVRRHLTPCYVGTKRRYRLADIQALLSPPTP